MYALTTPQQNIWNLQQFYGGTSISNNCGAMFFDKKCSHEILNQALNKLVESHTGMRLRFREKNGHTVQYAAAYQPEVFSSEFFEDRQTFQDFAQHYARIPFHMTDSPMYRFVIFDLEGKSGVLMCANHMISDAWAISLMASTVHDVYQALESGAVPEVKEYDYLQFAESERQYFASARYEKDKAYWNDKYPTRPEICAIKPNSVSAQTSDARRYTIKLSAELSTAITGFCGERNISPAVLFEAGIITYLSRINPECQDVSLGMLVLNRSSAREKQTVGTYISTMPLTVRVSDVENAAQLFEAINTAHFQLFRHQRYPYSHILQNLHERYGFSGNLYEVMVSYQNAQTGTDTTTEWYSNGHCEVPMEFHIDNRDGSDHYTLNIDYQRELFSTEEIPMLIGRILFVLEQIIADPAIQLSQISILSAEEYRKVIDDFNQTYVPYAQDKCAHELFAEQVAQHPDKVALVFEDKQFTFRQLDRMSNALANHLRAKGIGRGSIVPIVSKRTWQIIVAMLGIMKSGAAYMHIDITYPEDRIAYMFETANSTFGLTCGYNKPLPLETLSLETFDYDGDCTPLENTNESSDLCYVIFTSGSTGKPKGLMIAHRNIANFSAYHGLNVFGAIIPNKDSSIVALASTSFDMSVTETLLPLTTGITAYLANDEQTLSQEKLAKFFDAGSIRIMETTPTKMRLYIADKSNTEYLRSVEAFILGGEALPMDLYKELQTITSAKIFNNYGPAETTVWSTIKEMTDDDITIGKPIANTQIYILDANRNPLPIGVAGELCISGDGVGMGYLNRPELTAEKFVPNPFIPGTTMYCTGDLARWRVDGEIDYLGRIDTQVKIRGLRIELGEIESVMSQFEGIQLTAVTDKRDETGRQYLVGYYTAECEIDEKALRSHLSAALPKYMVPNYFMRLETLPMTTSGKTDRKALPTPEFTAQERIYVAPETPLETALCTILTDLFKMEQIGVTDDFFELGGDSLRAIEYVALVHNEGITIALQNVFDYPTVRQLAQFITEGKQGRVTYSSDNFKKYEPLLAVNVIDETFVPARKNLGNVFLTGATGFLGSHILDQLMKEDSGKIYCLVRGGKERLMSTLKYYFGDIYTTEISKRIFAIDGDITNETLTEMLPDDIQTVIHSAASVKHYGAYDYFHGINVQGTKNVIACARKAGAKMIHVSTLSVSGNSLVDIFDLSLAAEDIDFAETSLYIDQPLDNVYIHSKFEAELAVLDAALEGLDTKIVRVGNLTNRTSDFKFQPNYQSNSFLNRMKAALELGCLPDYLIPLYAEFSPIDQTAEGIVKIAQYADQQTVFHLNSNKNLYFDRMIELVNQFGISMKTIDGSIFNATLQQLSGDEKRGYIYEAFQNDLDEHGKLVYDSNIHILNAFTVWFMRKLGFEWIDIDCDYVKGYVEYFRKIGYLEV